MRTVLTIALLGPWSGHPDFIHERYSRNDVPSVIHQIALSLNQGVPEDWQRLMEAPTTSGTSGVETIVPSDLRSTVESWGLDDDMNDKTYRQLHSLIHSAIENGVYISQGFSYNWPQIEEGHPASLSTLIVVVRIPYVMGGYVWKAELTHLFITSAAKVTPICHPCWLGLCHPPICRSRTDLQELRDVQDVLSKSQSDWALDHIPPPAKPFSDSSVSRLSSTTPWLTGGFDALLKTIIDNNAENRDVHRTYKGGLLEAFQNSTLSRRQASNSMRLTLNEQDIIPFLEDMLSSCFSRAGLSESVAEWWRRVYTKNQDDPISFECEFAEQQIEPVVPPVTGCIATTNGIVDTSYSWLLVVPSNNILNILFMEGDLVVAFQECEPDDDVDTTLAVPSDKHTSEGHTSEGHASDSMIRWGYVNPNGSFRSVEYLSRWMSYPSFVSKVLLDMFRFVSAASYLKIQPPPQKKASVSVSRQQYGIQSVKHTTLAPLTLDPSFVALMESIKLFAETWEKVAKAIGSSTVTTLQRRVCLGFDKLDYNATTSILQGVEINNLANIVDEIIDTEGLPKRDDIKRLLSGVKYSTNFTWFAESMTFSNPDGQQSFMFFAKYADRVTGMANVVYSVIKSSFALAKDMLIVRRKSTGCFGLCNDDTTSIEYIPHTLTMNDTLILEIFWEMIAFHQMAASLGVEPPKYPDLSGFCDRSIP
ncbi:hypothetical protein BGZ72_005428 [Mortierella alpina]|nr:hypothetical protein BGZ72_005428 [Mortierella alpina]